MYRSFLIDIQHAEGSCLIVLSFIFDREDHDLIAGEAVALLLGDLKNQGHQLILVLLYKLQKKKRWSLVSLGCDMFFEHLRR